MSRLQEGIYSLKIDAGSEQLEVLDALLCEVVRFSSKVHIVSRSSDVREEITKQILDSAAILRLQRLPQVVTLLDVGSSIGFPGLVLAILRSEWKVVLLDRSEKRITWARLLASKLHISNVDFIVGEFPQDLHKITYNTLISKAFLPIDAWFKNSEGLMKPGDLIIGMTTPKHYHEAINTPIEVIETDQFSLPFYGIKRLNILGRKV